MKVKLFILLFYTVCTAGVFSQKKIAAAELKAVPPVVVSMPFKVDSTNIKGGHFNEKELLKMPVSIPPQERFTIKLDADTAGYFHPARPNENTVDFHLFSFYVYSDRYAEASLKVTSPGLFEIYVDDKLEASKTTKEQTLNGKNNAAAKLSPYPAGSRVVIKLMSSYTDSIPPVLKAEIENAAEDSLTQFKIVHDDMRPVNFKDMMLGKRVVNAKISPLGRYVLVTYRNTFGETSETSVELYDNKTGNRMLIDLNNQKKQLNWMPESEKLYYTASAGTKKNIMTIDPASMQESILAKDIPDASIRFAPDEKSFFYTKQEKGEESSSGLTLLESPRQRRGGYFNRSFIYRYDLQTGLSQQLTFGSTSTILNDISADSKHILFSIWEETITERPFGRYTMIKLQVEAMTADTLWMGDPFASQALFSPDGTKVLIQGSADAFGGAGLNLDEGQISNTYNHSAFIMDLAAKEIEPITLDFSPSISSMQWSRRDNLIYFLTVDEDFQHIYSYNPSNKVFTKLPLEEEFIRGFSTASRAAAAAYYGVSLSNSTKAYAFDLKKKKSTLIADPYKDRLDKIETGEVKEWNFVNSDNVEIKGRYYLPPHFDPSKKYPVIVYYYGGTTPTGRTFESSYPGHVYASFGYVVYVLQPSGTIGFGQKFASMHVNAWGKRTSEDIIEGTKKFLHEHTFTDSTKVGCLGASYGGFMTMYLQTQTDMFAAAVSHAGISSISSYWGEGYWGYGYSSAASAYSYPWNNYDLYVNQSPLFNADKINTPILLTHGTVDTNVPPGESIQMYTALKILGKPVEYIQVKDENHGVANYKRRLEWFNSIMAWFDKWLKDDPAWWNSLYGDKK